jgi:hypothetical protein
MLDQELSSFFRLAIGDARWVSGGGRPQKKENKIDPNQSILFGEEI